MCEATGDALPGIRKAQAEGFPLPPSLTEPPLMDEAKDVFALFGQLHQTRGNNGYGPSPITFSELAAFIELTGRRLTPFVIDQIRNLDVTYLNALAAAMPKEK